MSSHSLRTGSRIRLRCLVFYSLSLLLLLLLLLLIPSSFYASFSSALYVYIHRSSSVNNVRGHLRRFRFSLRIYIFYEEVAIFNGITYLKYTSIHTAGMYFEWVVDNWWGRQWEWRVPPHLIHIVKCTRHHRVELMHASNVYQPASEVESIHFTTHI